jgi:hypothetical protein
LGFVPKSLWFERDFKTKNKSKEKWESTSTKKQPKQPKQPNKALETEKIQKFSKCIKVLGKVC